MNKIVFLDTETGGLNPQKNDLLSIGLVLWDGRILDTKEIFVQGDPDRCDAEALNVNNINLEKHNATALTKEDALVDLYRWLKRHFPGNHDDPSYRRAVMGGWNAPFDQDYIRILFDTVWPGKPGDREPSTMAKLFDKCPLEVSSVVRFLSDNGLVKPSRSLKTACANLDVTNRKVHSALADAEATAYVYERCLDIQKKLIRAAGPVRGSLAEVPLPVPDYPVTEPINFVEAVSKLKIGKRNA